MTVDTLTQVIAADDEGFPVPDSKDANSNKSTSDTDTQDSAPEKAAPAEPATVAIPKSDPKSDPKSVQKSKTDKPSETDSVERTEKLPVPESATVAIPKVTPAQPPKVTPAQRAAPARVRPVISTPATPVPTRIAPATPEKSKRSGKWWYIAAAVAAVLVLVAVVVALFANRDSAASSPEAQVQTAITTYVDALQSGDLATLRTSTCGGLAEYYRGIPDQVFTQVHDNAIAQKTIPQIGAVDAVRITDNTAIAQVQATLASTGEQSWRTFDLENQDGTWKVCDPK